MSANQLSWLHPRNWSFTILLALGAIFLVIGTVASATLLTSQAVEEGLTEQIGENFSVQARSVSNLVKAFFVEKGNQIQALAVTDVIRKGVEERNQSYTGNPDTILDEILLLDEAWRTATDDDVLITNTTSDEFAVNPAASQLQDSLAAFPDQSEIFITDRYGATVAATGRLSDYYQADEEWWEAAWNDGIGAVYLSDLTFDESAQVNALLLAMPIFDQRGEIIGIIRSTLVLDDLFSEVISQLTIGQTGHAVLFDREGDVLFEPSFNENTNSKALSETLRESFVADNAFSNYQVAFDEQNEESIFGYAHLRGEDTVRSVSRRRWFETQIAKAVEGLDWTTVVRQKTDEAFSSVELIIQSIQSVGFLLGLISVFLTVLFARTITQPLKRLEQAAQEVGKGNLAINLPPAGNNEIGNLTNSFKKMTLQLRAVISELTAHRDSLSKINDELEREIRQRKETEKALQKFTNQLQTAAELTKQINAILDVDQLLTETVSQLQTRFKLYHVHIYLLHKRQNLLIMHRGSGKIGLKLRAMQHGIAYDQSRSLVARAAREQKSIIVHDVHKEPTYLPNPLLPDTRSECALPLISGNKVLGVLDVQDNESHRFSKGDLHVLNTLAGQIATALQNARLFNRVNKTADQLREMDRLKSEFLASMSHELRTPLNSIIGYSEIMLMGINGPLNAESTEDVQAILKSGRHLLNLINDILDLAKIEAGRMTLDIDEVNIHALLDDIQVSHAPQLKKKSLRFVLDLEKNLPNIEADPLRLKQILTNLVTNAVKFTEKGHIYLRATKENEWVNISVQDEGIGISEEDLSSIFEQFRQVDGSSTRRAEGTGLGLTITNHLVELHGGKIHVESTLNVGSTFTVRLPVEQKKSE